MFARETAGAACTRPFPRPLISEGGNFLQNSGTKCREIAKFRLRMTLLFEE
jgi:hypothetical protein